MTRQREKKQLLVRIALMVTAGTLALAAAALSDDWYDALPRPADAPPRAFRGTTLLRLALVVDSVLLAWFALRRRTARVERPFAQETMEFGPQAEKMGDLSRNQVRLILPLIIVLGAALRFYMLGHDLWLDEIGAVVTYAARPLGEIYAAYLSPGNHLLNSLLVRVAVSAFGESEWSVRLAAALFGIATVPVMYVAARVALSRAASVGAALLLAVSYHHIFFSQNARGYSGHLFGALLACALLAKAIRQDLPARWVGYVLSMTVAFAALMSAAFTFAAHLIVGAVAVASRRRKGRTLPPLGSRMIKAFAITGYLAFHIYAIVVPDVLAIYPTVYGVQGSGYIIFSREFLAELQRGVFAGFGVGPLALLFLGTGAVGFVILARRSWELAMSLLLSIIITLLYLIVKGQTIAPRLLLLGVPLAILACVAAIEAGARLLSRRGVISSPPALKAALGVTTILALISLLALPGYYSAPKQPYRAAIRYIENERDGEAVTVVFPAVGGFRYYLAKEKVSDTATYHFVGNMTEYEAVLTSLRPGEGLLATTLFRVLRSGSDTLADRITRDWVAVKTFRGTVGGGDISVWRRRDAARVD